MKNCTKNSLKKLTFATLHPTIFESLIRKFEVIAFLFTKLSTDTEKISSFFEKRLSFVHLTTTRDESITRSILLLMSSREGGCEYKLNQVCIDFGLTRPVIEPKSTVSAAGAFSTRLMTKNDKIDKINSVVIYRMLCCTFD